MASLGQQQIKTQLENPQDTIQRLRAMGDSELMQVSGMTDRLKAFKRNLEEADQLTGKAREAFIENMDKRLAPNVDGYDLDWMIRDAKRADKDKDVGPACC